MRHRVRRDGRVKPIRTIDPDGILFGVFVVCAIACLAAIGWYAWVRLHQ